MLHRPRSPAALLQLVACDHRPCGLLNALQHRQEGLRIGPRRARLEILGGAGGGDLFCNRQAHKVVQRGLRLWSAIIEAPYRQHPDSQTVRTE